MESLFRRFFLLDFNERRRRRNPRNNNNNRNGNGADDDNVDEENPGADRIAPEGVVVAGNEDGGKEEEEEEDDDDEDRNVNEAKQKNSLTSYRLERLSSTDRNRRCWVCFAAENDDDAPDDEWLHPCHCKKSMKWVHQACINRWVDEKQNGNAFRPVKCAFCLYEYEFEYPGGSPIAKPINLLENWVLYMTNNVPAFVILRLGSTVFELLYFGAELDLLQKLVVWFLMEVTIPVPWTLLLLLELRIQEMEMVLVRATAPDDVFIPEPDSALDSIQDMDMGDFIRVRLVPSFAIITGEFLFHDVIPSRVMRCIAGAAVYTAIRAAVRVPYRRDQFKMAASRRVMNVESRG